MKITATIESQPGADTLVLSSAEENDTVHIAAGAESRTVNGGTLERAIQNGLNVGTSPDPALLVSSRVTEADSGKTLTVENHVESRELVVVKIGQEVRNVNGRQLMAGVRHCLKTG